MCKDGGEEAWARFFGQSSFAEYTLAAESSVVNVNDLLQSDEELNLFAPLGCGFQTGMGAVANVADAGPEDVVMVMGMGAVGMAALMVISFYTVDKYVFNLLTELDGQDPERKDDYCAGQIREPAGTVAGSWGYAYDQHCGRWVRFPAGCP